MSMSRPGRLLLAACLAALGCGGGESGPPDAAPDAGDPNALTCDTAGGVGGETYGMTVGIKVGETGFEELSDGDQCPLVIGAQGLLMLLLDVRGTFSIPEDSVCLDCAVDVGPSGNFGGISQPSIVVFRRLDETMYDGYLTIILGSRAELSDELDGASLPVTIECIGHGFSETLTRELALYVLD